MGESEEDGAPSSSKKLMANSTTSAHPIRSLREQVTTLEAAITLCLADPKEKPVHKLRTTTRRIEAQLALLEVMPKVPEYGKAAREATRMLKKVRRAAGEVRDTDVQLDLIKSVVQEDAPRSMKSAARKLSKELEADREDSSRKLMKLLRRRQSDLARPLEEILEILEPVEKLSLSASELASLTQRWFAKNTPPEPRQGADAPDYLHAIRKVAKLTRYIAENAPKQAKRPRSLAESFERLQQSGGEWHDWLVLSEIAGDKLSEASPLTKALSDRSRTALAAYRQHLREMSG
jgi:CHAD domain-containing protein